MQIQVCNHSSYPGEGTVRSCIADQVALGLDWVTVSPRGAGDPITGVAACLDGARLGEPSAVWFRTTPVRQLRVQARLRNRLGATDGGEHLPRGACAAAQTQTAIPIKLAVTGPYTLSRLAQIETTAYRDADQLATDLANHLSDLVREAVAAGARFVQIDEPALLRDPGDVRIVRELLEPLQDAAEGRALLAVSTYGAAVGGLYAQLNSLPGDVVALDCATSASTFDEIAATGSGKPLALGLASGDDALDPAQLARRVGAALRRYAHDVLYLQPARGLDAVSGASARRVLETLIETRRLLHRDSPSTGG